MTIVCRLPILIGFSIFKFGLVNNKDEGKNTKPLGYNVSVSVFTYCHKKLIKRGGLPSFVSLLWKVANGLAIGFYNSPMVHWVAIGQSCQGCR